MKKKLFGLIFCLIIFAGGIFAITLFSENSATTPTETASEIEPEETAETTETTPETVNTESSETLLNAIPKETPSNYQMETSDRAGTEASNTINYYKDGSFRIDTTTTTGHQYTIYNKTEGKTYIWDDSKSGTIIIDDPSIESSTAISNSSPVYADQLSEEDNPNYTVYRDSLDGEPVIVISITEDASGGTVVSETWYSIQYGIPIQYIQTVNGTCTHTYTVKNIQENTVDDSIFIPPDDISFTVI